MNFDSAFDVVIRNEGGYVNHPMDPGGETKFGISKWQYPGEDIAGLTLNRAREIYRRDFWGALRCDQLPDAIRLSVFDAAVNSGTGRAAKWLQRAVGAKEDGIVGAETVGKARETDPVIVVLRLNGYRLRFLSDLPTWAAFGQGWARRVASILSEVSHG